MKLSLNRRSAGRIGALLSAIVAVLLATAGPANAAPLDTEHRMLYNYYTGHCIYESDAVPSSVAVTTTSGLCDGVAYYEWKGNGDYTIRNDNTGYCLTTSAASGSSVSVYAALCGGSAYQKWSWSSPAPGKPQGTLKFHNLGNNWYLDTNAGTLFTAPGSTTSSQAWYQCFEGSAC